jgi:mRNA-decapping enzyme 1B
MASPSPEPSSTSSPAALTSLLASMVVSSTEPGSATGSPVPQSRASSASSPSSPSPSLNATGGVALDKKSLQLALLSLIQDDRFLDLLHSQYLRVVHARVKKQQQQNNGST